MPQPVAQHHSRSSSVDVQSRRPCAAHSATASSSVAFSVSVPVRGFKPLPPQTELHGAR